METHPLNLAHQQQRLADAHLKYKRFDEAIQCHQNAAELLLDAMKSITSPVTLESLTLQHQYHLKQKDLVQSKKEQYARIKKAMENLKKQSKDVNLPINDNSKLQVAIYKNINETDSLLETLSSLQEKTSEKIPVNKNLEISSKDTVDGKSSQSTMNDLQYLNRSLHVLVDQLMTQVEVLKDENMTLSERVKYFEKERARYLNIQSSDFLHQNNFSNISLVSDGFMKETLELDIHPPVQERVYSGVPRPVQQPHFDLSAFKDDY